MSLNKVMLLGNLGADPEVRYMQNGNAVANFSVATTEKWKDKQSGEQKEKTEWHRVVVFGNTAETIAQWFRKGDTIFVEGKLQTRKWEDKDGVERYTTEVILDRFSFAGKASGGSSGGSQRPQSRQQEPENQDGPQQQDQFDDDIPF